MEIVGSGPPTDYCSAQYERQLTGRNTLRSNVYELVAPQRDLIERDRQKIEIVKKVQRETGPEFLGNHYQPN